MRRIDAPSAQRNEAARAFDSRAMRALFAMTMTLPTLDHGNQSLGNSLTFYLLRVSWSFQVSKFILTFWNFDILLSHLPLRLNPVTRSRFPSSNKANPGNRLAYSTAFPADGLNPGETIRNLQP